MKLSDYKFHLLYLEGELHFKAMQELYDARRKAIIQKYGTVNLKLRGVTKRLPKNTNS